MMPLWTTVTPEPSQASIGCAFASITPPCVAQRVWASPVVAGCDAGADRVAQHRHLADPAGDVDLAVDQADAGRVVAAVLEPLEPGEQQLLARPATDVSDDSAHQAAPPISAVDDLDQMVAHGARTTAASAASTITRTTGSVPDARTHHAAVLPELRLGGLDLLPDPLASPASAPRSARHGHQLLRERHDQVGELRPSTSPSRSSAPSSMSAVARPSPVVWWVEVDHVAGLLAAERRARSRASARARSGRRRRSPRPRCRARASRGGSPRFVIEVTTTRSTRRGAVASIASTAMIASPFTGRPRRVDRQAAVGVAVEREAAGRPGGLAPPRRRRSRCVEPTPSLMLRPSGVGADDTGRRVPSRSKSAGATAYAAPFAQSTTTAPAPCTPLAVGLDQPVDVVARRRPRALDARRRPAPPGPSRSAASIGGLGGRRRACARRRRRNLMPLSW